MVWTIWMLLPSYLWQVFWLIGLISHLKTYFPAIYRLYEVLKNHSSLPTLEELLIASGKKILNTEAACEFLKNLENALATIIQVFNKQSIKDAVSWMLVNAIGYSLLHTGQDVGPAKIWNLACGVDCCMWSTLWGSWVLTVLNFESFLSTHTSVPHLEYHIVLLLTHASWKWVKIQLK